MSKNTRLAGIEIGGTKLQLVLGAADGTVSTRQRLTVNPSRGGAGIREQIQTVLASWQQTRQTFDAVGVGFGGPVDWQTGAIACSHQIEGWTGVNLKAWLADLAPVPVRVDNDANTAALGEALLGAGRGFNPAFYMNMGSGVGGGLVVDGQIYHGAKPGEAEIGHVRLDRAGATVESRCSGWAVDQRIRELVKTEPASRLAALTRGVTRGEARFLSQALMEKDAGAARLLQELAEDLAFGLSHVVHLFHPEVVVLGGGLSLLGEPLREAVAQALPQFIMHAFAPGPQIRLAALGEDCVPVGALALAAEALQRQPK